MDRANPSYASIFMVDPCIDVPMKDRTLKFEFDYKAVYSILVETGIDLFRDGLQREQLLKLENLLPIIYAGLQRHQPELTKEDVSNMFSMRHWGAWIQVIIQAMDIILPPSTGEVLEGEVVDIPLAPESSGLNSGQEPASLGSLTKSSGD